jgi:hypothetical protein
VRVTGLSQLSYALLAVLALWEARALAQPAAPCAQCAVVIVEPGDRERLPIALGGLEVLVRVPAGEEGPQALLLDIRDRGGKPGLLIDGLPSSDAVNTAPGPLETLVIRLKVPSGELVALAFDLKTRLTALRAALPLHVRIGVAAPGETLRNLLERDLAPYLDFVVSESAPSSPVPWWRDAGELNEIRSALKPQANRAGRSLWLGSRDPEVFARTLADLASSVPFLPGGLIPATGLRIACGERESEVWLDPATLDRVAWIPHCSRERLRISPDRPVPEIVTLSSGDLLVRVAETSPERFAQDVEVRAARPLTIEEIIARHQSAAARQALKVRTRISTGTLTMSFEAPGFPAPLTISSEAVIYSDRTRTEIEQRSIRVNGLRFGDGGVPRLPLIEPERVGAVPLAIELTDVYRYTLQGTDTIRSTTCYVVGFEPVAANQTLFRGTAWIAGDTFALVKAAAVQVRLRGPIVSSEQTDEFVKFEGDVWLLGRSTVNQIYQGAGHRTPIERVLAIDRHEINAPDFIVRRTAAYASDHVMLRDTADGYQYIERKTGDRSAPAGESSVETRLEGSAERVRTIAIGVIVDPNISHPLPFAGLSYIDFNLFGSGTQFNGFFGGTYGQAAFSIPSLGGSRWQLAGRAFAIATAFNDRAFVEGREEYVRNIRQQPAHASVWALRPLTSRVSLRTGYDFDYTHYARADSTAADFAVPAAQVVHALRIALEGQRKGWNASVWWSAAMRQGWRRWGTHGDGEYDPEHRDFQRYGASLARSTVLSPNLVGRVEAVWMDGRDLDRFSRYTFGAFDNRLVGYPGALIRYDRGAVLRGALAWSAGSRLRLDAFADSAFVRDPGFGRDLMRFNGFGTAVEVPGPFRALLSAEWGFGVQGRRADGGRGTHVFRVTGYKIF